VKPICRAHKQRRGSLSAVLVPSSHDEWKQGLRLAVRPTGWEEAVGGGVGRDDRRRLSVSETEGGRGAAPSVAGQVLVALGRASMKFDSRRVWLREFLSENYVDRHPPPPPRSAPGAGCAGRDELRQHSNIEPRHPIADLALPHAAGSSPRRSLPPLASSRCARASGVARSAGLRPLLALIDRGGVGRDDRRHPSVREAGAWSRDQGTKMVKGASCGDADRGRRRGDRASGYRGTRRGG